MANYWQDRMAAAQNTLTDKSKREIDKQLRKYYATAAQDVINGFESVYNKLLAQQEQNKPITPADLYKLDKYWAMQGQLRQQLQRLGEKQISLLTKKFELTFFDVYHSINIEGAVAFSTIDKAAVNQIINAVWCADGLNFSQRVWRNTEQLIQTLNEQLILTVATGKKTTDLKKALQERFVVSYHQADMIVRTELAHIQSRAAEERYKSYGIKQVQFWADEDERRCPDCGKLHEKKYPVGAVVPIPLHPRCRCCIVPVID